MDALTATINGHEGFKNSIADVEMTLQFETTDAPEGTEPVYHITIADGTATAAPGPADDPDATITNDYETAVAISKGDLNTQMAFMTGKLKVGGNMAKLMMNQAMLAQYAEAGAGLDVEY
jgi:putative sterol carrier protein